MLTRTAALKCNERSGISLISHCGMTSQCRLKKGQAFFLVLFPKRILK